MYLICICTQLVQNVLNNLEQTRIQIIWKTKIA